MNGTISVKTLLRIVAAVIVVAGAAWFGWTKYNDSQDSQRMDQISAQVKESMQKWVRDDPDIGPYNLRVLRVELIKVGDAKYEGMAAVRTAASTKEHDIRVEVTSDGERAMWESPPGEFLFLANEDPNATAP
jgi:hypothetical protein